VGKAKQCAKQIIQMNQTKKLESLISKVTRSTSRSPAFHKKKKKKKKKKKTQKKKK